MQPLLYGKPMKRKHFVSESWSQAAIITKDQKLGIMLDPTSVHKNWDYRGFGDMYFDRKTDSQETNNKINDIRSQQKIRTLRGYYDEFVRNTPATGKDEIVNQKIKK